MAEKHFARLRDWVEPAHPMIVQLHDDLIAIYTHLQKKYQTAIDKAFDQVSRQIGFVVTTTVPVVIEIGNKGVVKGVTMGAEHLKGTLFDKELSAALSKLKEDRLPIKSAGTYNLFMLWHEALKLKLRTDWMEPAHFRPDRLATLLHPEVVSQIRPGDEVREPAHWFDPGVLIAAEEKVLISVIDEVYADLRLGERIATVRDDLRRMILPDVMEPAHFRRLEHGLRPEAFDE